MRHFGLCNVVQIRVHRSNCALLQWFAYNCCLDLVIRHCCQLVPLALPLPPQSSSSTSLLFLVVWRANFDNNHHTDNFHSRNTDTRVVQPNCLFDSNSQKKKHFNFLRFSWHTHLYGQKWQNIARLQNVMQFTYVHLLVRPIPPNHDRALRCDCYRHSDGNHKTV